MDPPLHPETFNFTPNCVPLIKSSHRIPSRLSSSSSSTSCSSFADVGASSSSLHACSEQPRAQIYQLRHVSHRLILLHHLNRNHCSEHPQQLNLALQLACPESKGKIIPTIVEIAASIIVAIWDAVAETTISWPWMSKAGFLPLLK
ncbi:unnamed protein product [Linum trigynum]|uniref:Uncharacterized protein n=1 Tax=Linum trigynum TaxID=586398 RepID=A0AAV2EDJ8_9ROSI